MADEVHCEVHQKRTRIRSSSPRWAGPPDARIAAAAPTRPPRAAASAAAAGAARRRRRRAARAGRATWGGGMGKRGDEREREREGWR